MPLSLLLPSDHQSLRSTNSPAPASPSGVPSTPLLSLVTTPCQVVRLEEHLRLFVEPAIQRFFLQSSMAMWWTNRIYSYVHLPATISFLVGLYWYCITRTRSRSVSLSWQNGFTSKKVDPSIYEARRRALAVSNLLAFIVFSTWPCMPPRLLDDKDGGAADGELERKFGFADTVHARNGAVSVWYVPKSSALGHEYSEY